MSSELFNFGSNLFSSVVDNLWADARQDDQQKFNAEQYAKRYQVQTADMMAAGLNPMLSVAQSPGSGPSSGIAHSASSLLQASQGASQKDVNNAQINLLNAQARNANADALVKERFGLEQGAANLAQTLANTDLTKDQRNQVQANTDHTLQLINNAKTDQARMQQLIVNLNAEYQNLVKQGLNITEAGNVMRAQIAEIKARTDHESIKQLVTDLERKQVANSDEFLRQLGLDGRYKGAVDFLRFLFRR